MIPHIELTELEKVEMQLDHFCDECEFIEDAGEVYYHDYVCDADFEPGTRRCHCRAEYAELEALRAELEAKEAAEDDD